MRKNSHYFIGIDLGTTNSAVAYINADHCADGTLAKISTFLIPQLVKEREIESFPVLPSFLYLADEAELSSGNLNLPWKTNPSFVVGTFAQEQGALSAGRQISSAKSWLCNDMVDRSAKILPWGDSSLHIGYSPVEVTAAYINHIKDSWNHVFTSDKFEDQEIVVTVPASFDEEARELTVQAVHDAGIRNLILLEEPLAAFYAWIFNNQNILKKQLKDNDLVLVCDVGGGTTDFSLIRVLINKNDIKFERIAIGEHLLLGGDNVDAALVKLIEQKFNLNQLTLRQYNALKRQCCTAKEKILNDSEVSSVKINLLGTGSSVIGKTITVEITRSEVEELLMEGFLPYVTIADLQKSNSQIGLRELGLSYASDPAITRHLTEFLFNNQTNLDNDESSKISLACPHAILFNGGFFTPEKIRNRLVEVITTLFSINYKKYKPKVLATEISESLVAVGAAYYSQVKRGLGFHISGGSGRAYYIGIQTEVKNTDHDKISALCIMPRGTEEGTVLTLSEREFTVLTNRPVAFTLYSSVTRHDKHGEIVFLNESELHKHSPLITVLRYGKRSLQSEIKIYLIVKFTEVGTLELWCEAHQTEHKWRLQFELRGLKSQENIQSEEISEENLFKSQVIISEESINLAEKLIEKVFGSEEELDSKDVITPELLTGKLELALGYGKDDWPLDIIRRLWELLEKLSSGRKKSAKFEARWLNLFGFCLRPGFGAVLDDWRIGKARKIYLAGLIFPNDIQCQVEWIVLLQRIVGGLNAGQQMEIYQKYRTLLGIGTKKKDRKLNSQIEREGWRLLASLEHLPASIRTSLGNELLEKIKIDQSNKSYLWSLGRLGARIPFYGQLNNVVFPENIRPWIEFLLESEITSEVASVIIQLGAYTEDRARDILPELRELSIKKLTCLGILAESIEALQKYIPLEQTNAPRIFGESLPEGLKLIG